VLTAVVTQVGEAFTVHLTSVPPTTTPEQQTSTTQGGATAAKIGAEVPAGAVTDSDGNLVAKDGTAHVGIDQAASGPGPIQPEVKEVAWGAGAFIIFALIMRYLAFPRLKKGMDARYSGIVDDHKHADASRLAAKAEVADYQAQLAGVKAEATAHLEQARQTVEVKRTERIAAINVQIAEQRAAAAAENDAARAAVQSQIQAAVADVASSAIRLAVGKAPSSDVVDRVVNDVMSAGARQ
jgi:F-type H+-transporting ATPase subunit b